MQLLTQIHQQGTALLIVAHDHDIAGYSQKLMKISAGQFVD
ncbi:hypothetical protein [Gilliamella sp. ESL0250]|nr:hypothetical protein [Gilliamella sp. ESL0250]